MDNSLISILTLLYGLGGIITFLGYFPTVKDLWLKKASANIHTYLIWTITMSIASLYGFLVLKDLPFIIVTNLNLLACASILFLGLRLKYIK